MLRVSHVSCSLFYRLESLFKIHLYMEKTVVTHVVICIHDVLIITRSSSVKTIFFDNSCSTIESVVLRTSNGCCFI